MGLTIMHEYPQMVCIKTMGENVLGGKLINENTFLMLSQCVQDWDFKRKMLDFYELEVILGEYVLKNATGNEKVFKRNKIYIHTLSR